jgi:hypothetical protein
LNKCSSARREAMPAPMTKSFCAMIASNLGSEILRLRRGFTGTRARRSRRPSGGVLFVCAVFIFRQEGQDLLAVGIIIGVLEQRFAAAWAGQVHVDDLADGGAWTVGHHHHAVGQQDRPISSCRLARATATRWRMLPDSSAGWRSLAWSSPAMWLISVDFPVPANPRIARNSPSRTDRLMSFRISSRVRPSPCQRRHRLENLDDRVERSVGGRRQPAGDADWHGDDGGQQEPEEHRLDRGP